MWFVGVLLVVVAAACPEALRLVVLKSVRDDDVRGASGKTSVDAGGKVQYAAVVEHMHESDVDHGKNLWHLRTCRHLLSVHKQGNGATAQRGSR